MFNSWHTTSLRILSSRFYVAETSSLKREWIPLKSFSVGTLFAGPHDIVRTAMIWNSFRVFLQKPFLLFSSYGFWLEFVTERFTRKRNLYRNCHQQHNTCEDVFFQNNYNRIIFVMYQVIQLFFV